MSPTRKTHPIMMMISMTTIDLPAPLNISLWWNYGSLLIMFLLIQIITGIFLSMHYSPNTDLAFFSLTHINRDVNWGWLLHSSHMNGASMFLLLMYIHMARGLYYNSFYMINTWNIGVSVFIMTMATAFMGYVLPWGQMSFWGATVITNIFSAIPYLGQQLVEWLWGGFTMSNPTLNRFFIIHFILPLIIMFMVILHLVMLHETGSNNPLGINSNSDRVPFHHFFTTKDIMGFTIFTFMFFMIITLFPNLINDPENLIEANPLMTPKHIQPEWYFLWLYAILRSIPNKLGGVIALLLAIFILYLPPLTFTKTTMNFNPLTQSSFHLMVSSWLMLSWIGSCPVESPFILIGQIFTSMYFLYYLTLNN